MLVGTPFPVKLSAFEALGRKLWIRQSRFESWRGNSPSAQPTTGRATPWTLCGPLGGRVTTPSC